MAILGAFSESLREKVLARIKESIEAAENPPEGKTFQGAAVDILEQAIFLFMLSDKKMFGE